MATVIYKALDINVNYDVPAELFRPHFGDFEEKATSANFPPTTRGVRTVGMVLLTFEEAPCPTTVLYGQMLEQLGYMPPSIHDLFQFGVTQGNRLNKIWDKYLSIICLCEPVSCGPLGREVTPQLEKTPRGLSVFWNYINKDGSPYDVYLGISR